MNKVIITNKNETEKEELMHYGVLGMKWGVRKDNSDNSDKISRHTQRLVKKDIRRYADAKMFYGQGAGTRRKLLKAELENKRTKIPGYAKAFDAQVKDANYAKSAVKAKRERTRKDTAYRARVSTKQFFGVTGSLTVTAASALYFANKQAVDAFVMARVKDVVTKLRP